MSSTGYCTNVEQEDQTTNFKFICEHEDAYYNDAIGRCVFAAQSAKVKVCPEIVRNTQTDVNYILKLDETHMGWDLDTGVLNQTNCTYEVPKSETLFFCPPGFEMSTSTVAIDPAALDAALEGDFKVNIVTKGKDPSLNYSGGDMTEANDARDDNINLLEEAGEVASVYMPLCDFSDDGNVIQCEHEDFEKGKHIYSMPGKCSGDATKVCLDNGECDGTQTCNKNHLDHFENSPDLNIENGTNNRRLLRTDFIYDKFTQWVKGQDDYTWWDGANIQNDATYTFLYHNEGDTNNGDPKKFHMYPGFTPKPFHTYEGSECRDQEYNGQNPSVFKKHNVDGRDLLKSFDFTADFENSHKKSRVLQVIGINADEKGFATWSDSLKKCPGKSYYQLTTTDCEAET